MVSEAEIDAVIKVAMERGGGFGREDIRAELEAASHLRDQNQTELAASLCEQLMQQKPFCDRAWSRMALSVAARAIRRGRLLTEREKLENLATAFAEEGDEELAAHLRQLKAT